MGRRGPAPTPSALNALRGNPGHRTPNDAEPMPALVEALQPAPKMLTGEARREYKRLGPQLVKLGLLTEIDLQSFYSLCLAWADYCDARTKLRRGKVIKASRSGYLMPSPYVAIARHALAECNRLRDYFGMTPSSRTRVRVEKKGTAGAAPKSKVARFMERVG